VKSAYEIAMARLEKEKGPSRKLSDAQKTEIAGIDKKYDARAAEEKISFEGRMAKAANYEELERTRGEMASALTSIEDQREKAKAAVWDRE